MSASREINIPRWKIAVGSIVVSFLLFTAISEIVFRIIEPASPPGTTYGKVIHKNKHGLRDRDFTVPKPDSVFRILVLGDSFTWGVGLDVSQTIPKALEKRLNEEYKSAKFEVINAAIPGNNTVQELQLLKDVGLQYEPDIVLVIYNMNDVEYKSELAPSQYNENDVVPIVEIDPGEDITTYSKNRGLRGFILKIERVSAFARFLVPRLGSALRKAGLLQSVEFSWVEKTFEAYTDKNPGWQESQRALREIADITSEKNIHFLVAIYPLLIELRDYKGRKAHTTIKKFCQSEHISCVDLLPAFINKEERDFWINFMDAHPNEIAHRQVVEHVLPEMLIFTNSYMNCR